MRGRAGLLVVLLLLQACQVPGRSRQAPVLEFPELGVDDPAAYEGVQAVLDIAFSADGGERLAPYAASRRRRDDDDEEVGANGVEASRRGAPPPERARLVRPGSARRTAR